MEWKQNGRRPFSIADDKKKSEYRRLGSRISRSFHTVKIQMGIHEFTQSGLALMGPHAGMDRQPLKH
jgi:hypothetical protein